MGALAGEHRACADGTFLPEADAFKSQLLSQQAKCS